MKGNDRSAVRRIVNHLDEIAGFVEGFDREAFLNDRKTLSACAFALGQIGELAGGLDATFQNRNPQIPWKSLKGLRNRIVHDYENVDPEVLWAIVSKDVPELRRVLEKLISES